MGRPKLNRPDRENRRLALIDWRKRLGISRWAAGRLLHYSEDTIREWEHGRRYVPDDVMKMIMESGEYEE